MKGILAVVVAAGLLTSVLSTGLAISSPGKHAEKRDDGSINGIENQPTTSSTVYSDSQESEDDGGDDGVFDERSPISSSLGSGDNEDEDSISEEENSSSDDSLNGDDEDSDDEEGEGSPTPELIRMAAELSGDNEVPPVDTNATGLGRFTLNTVDNTLTYTITFSGLSGNETGAHIHGFAGEGTEAGVLHALPLGEEKEGTWHYNDSQEPQILDGLTYVNIHSVLYPDGEIRGQIIVKEVESPSEKAISLEPEDEDSDATGQVAIKLEELERYDRVELAVKVENLELAAGKVFEGWLVDIESGYSLSTGAFVTDSDGGATVESKLRLVDFGVYDSFVITEEPVGDTDPEPGTTVLSGPIG